MMKTTQAIQSTKNLGAANSTCSTKNLGAANSTCSTKNLGATNSTCSMKNLGATRATQTSKTLKVQPGAVKGGLAGALLTAAMLGGAPAMADESLDGMWRGKLKIQDGIYLTVGYTIRDGELTMDSPNQGMFGKSPTTYELEGNSLELSDNELSASFSGEF